MHSSLALTRRLVGMFGAIIQQATLPVFHTGQHLPFRRFIALQPISHDHPGHVRKSPEELAEESLGGFFIPPTLHENVEDGAILVRRPPEVVALAVDGKKDLSENDAVGGHEVLWPWTRA